MTGNMNWVIAQGDPTIDSDVMMAAHFRVRSSLTHLDHPTR